MKTSIKITISIAIMLCTTSCGFAKLSKLSDQVELVRVERIEPRGMTAMILVAEVRNDSSEDIVMRDGYISVIVDGSKVATLRQTEPTTAPAETTKSIRTIWRVEDVEPMMMMVLISKVVQKEFSGMEVEYAAELEVGRLKRSISGKEKDLTKILSIFAS